MGTRNLEIQGGEDIDVPRRTAINISCKLVQQGSADDRWVNTDKFS